VKVGPLFERQLVLWFQAHGWPKCRRLGQQGAADCGDLDGVADWLIQAKRTSAEDIGRACSAAETQARRAGKRRWVVIRRRRNHALRQAYVTMSLECFTDLIGGQPWDGTTTAGVLGATAEGHGCLSVPSCSPTPATMRR
jgi:hypothetical protein